MLRFGSICLSLALVLSSTGNAHHGIIGQFDLATTFTLDGRVTDIDFVNPHSYVYFDVADADGNTESWNCELRGATALRRSGWNKEMFATGTRVSIHGSPDWREANTCYVLEIDFPAEDLSLQRYQQLETTAVETTRAARTSWGAPNIGGDWAAPQFLPLEEEEAGILKPLDPNEPMNIDSFFREGGVLQAQGILNGQLTEQGEQMAAAFDRVSAPLYRCEAMNVLPDLIFDWYINQIVQTEDRIEILYGNSGQWRTIRLDEQDFPESIEPSRFGY